MPAEEGGTKRSPFPLGGRRRAGHSPARSAGGVAWFSVFPSPRKGLGAAPSRGELAGAETPPKSRYPTAKAFTCPRDPLASPRAARLAASAQLHRSLRLPRGFLHSTPTPALRRPPPGSARIPAAFPPSPNVSKGGGTMDMRRFRAGEGTECVR